MPCRRSLRPYTCAVLLLAGTIVVPGAQQDDLEHAVSVYSEKRFADAAALLQALVESDPTSTEAYLWLGLARAALKEWPAAREAYQKYAERAPRDVEGFRGVARTYEAESNNRLALVWYRKALQLAPADRRLNQAVRALLAATPNIETPNPELSDATRVSIAAPPAAPAKSGFWRQGVFGLVGASDVGWRRVLAVLGFGVCLLTAAGRRSHTVLTTAPTPRRSVIVARFAVAAALLYVVCWGVPTATGWGLLVVCVTACALAKSAMTR